MGKYEEFVKKHKNGVTIDLFIKAGSRKCVFPAGYNKHRNCIEMKVKSPAKDNKANMEVLRTIAEFFNKPFSKVLLVNGSTVSYTHLRAHET